MRGWAFLMLQQDDQAIEWHRRELAINPDETISQALLTAALALAGHSAEAHEALQRCYSLSDTKSTTVVQYKTQQLSISSNPKYLAFAQRFRDGLREAAMPEERTTGVASWVGPFWDQEWLNKNQPRIKALCWRIGRTVPIAITRLSRTARCHNVSSWKFLRLAPALFAPRTDSFRW